MKRILLFLIAYLPAFAQWSNGYTYKGTFVVQSGKVTGTQSNFTVVVAGTATGLKTAANGGHIQNTCSQTLYGLTVPADLIFTSDSAGSTVLTWQFDTYTATTGAYSAHVLMPNVDTGTNNTLYMWYGKSAVTTCQGGVASAAWDTNTVSALATPDGTTLNTSDYLGNTVTAGASVPTATAGPTSSEAGSASFSGTAGSSYLHIANVGRRSKPYTVCGFFNWTSHVSGTVDFLFGDTTVSGDFATVGLGRNNSTGHLSTYFTDNSLNYYFTDGVTAISTSGWHQACQVVSTTQIDIIMDGAQDGSTGSATGTPTSSSQTYLGIGIDGDSTTGNWSGAIGEITVDSTSRSTDWLNARYNNVINPATFWTATYDATSGGGGGAGTFTITPTAIPNGHSGNITLTLAGTSTSWDGTTVMTATGVANVSCGAVSVSSTTAATVVCTTGAGTGTLTLTESVTGTAAATTAVSVPSYAADVARGNLNSVQTLSLTGTNTVWSQETPAGLFTVAGGAGASIGTPTITTNTAGTVALTVGTAAGTLTITDTSTGKTTTFAAGGSGGGGCAVVGVM